MELRAKLSYGRCNENGTFIYFDGLFYDFGQNTKFGSGRILMKSR